MNLRRARARAVTAAPSPRSPLMVANAKGESELFIYDAIDPYADEYWGGISASMVRESLAETSGDVKVRINSPGGDVYDGIAILNLLRTHDGVVTVQIDGLAASAASFIAMAGEEIIIMPNAEMMIHDALMFTIGNAAELRADADRLDSISANIASAYADRAGGDLATWRDLMLAETWFSADEAVTAGLADRKAEVSAGKAGKVAALLGTTWDLPYSARWHGRSEAPAPIITPARAVAARVPEVPDASTLRESFAAELLAALTERSPA